MKFRIYAENTINPKGKIYYCGDSVEIGVGNRKEESTFILNQHGDLLLIDNKREKANMAWARISNNSLIKMMSSGIIDKNGKEIYEKDVVKVNSDEIGDVVFSDGCFWVMFYNEPAKEALYNFYNWNPETDKDDIVEIEVIGVTSDVR
jgi:hypothetical protein